MPNDVEASRISDVDRDPKSRRELKQYPRKFVRTQQSVGTPFEEMKYHGGDGIYRRGEIDSDEGVEQKLHHRSGSVKESNKSLVRSYVPIFIGTLDIGSLFDWIEAAEEFFEEWNPPEKLRCRLASYTFEGNAEIWWERLQRSRVNHGEAKVTSWEEMRAIMFHTFLPTKRLIKFPIQNYKKRASERDRYDSSAEIYYPIESTTIKSTQNHVKNNENGKAVKQKNDDFLPTKCLTEVPSESHYSKHEVVSDLGHFGASMNLTTNIGVDVLENPSSHKIAIDEKDSGVKSGIIESSRSGLDKFMPTRCLKEEIINQDVSLSLISSEADPNLELLNELKHNDTKEQIQKDDGLDEGLDDEQSKEEALTASTKCSLKAPIESNRYGYTDDGSHMESGKMLIHLFDPGGQWRRVKICEDLLNLTSMFLKVFKAFEAWEQRRSRIMNQEEADKLSHTTCLIKFQCDVSIKQIQSEADGYVSQEQIHLDSKDVGFVVKEKLMFMFDPGGSYKGKLHWFWQHTCLLHKMSLNKGNMNAGNVNIAVAAARTVFDKGPLLKLNANERPFGDQDSEKCIIEAPILVHNDATTLERPVLHQVTSSPQNGSIDFKDEKHRQVLSAFNRVIEVCDFEGNKMAVTKLESFLFDPGGIPISQYFENEAVSNRAVLFWNVIENAVTKLNKAHLGDGVEVAASIVREENVYVPSVSKGPEDVNLKLMCSTVVVKEYTMYSNSNWGWEILHGPAEYLTLAIVHCFQLNESEDQHSLLLKCYSTKVRVANMNVLFDPGGSLYFYGTSHLNECSLHGSNLSLMITDTHSLFYKTALLVVIGETKQGLVSWTNLLNVFMTALRSDKLVKGTLLGAEIKRTEEIWPTDMSVQFRMHIVLKLGKILLEMMRKSTKLTTKQSRISMTWHYMLHLLFVGSIAQAAPILSLVVLGGSYNRRYEMTEVRKDLYHITVTWRNRRRYVFAINHISDKTDTSRMPIAANKHSTSNGFTSAKFDKNVLGIGFCDGGHPIVKVLVFNFDLGGSQYLPIHLLHHKGVLKLKSCLLKENMKQPGLQASCYLHTSLGRLRKDKARGSAHAFIPFDPGGATDHSILDIERLIIIALTELKLTMVRAIGTNLKNDSCATSCNVRPLYNFNFTRGRVKLWEGWNDVNNSSTCIMADCNIVLVWPYLSILCNKNQFRTTSEMFHKLVNGLDPPTYKKMGWMASAYILLKVRSWTSFSEQGDGMM